MEIFSKYLPYIIYFIYLFEKELVLLDTGAMKAVKNQKMVLVGEESWKESGKLTQDNILIEEIRKVPFLEK